jgi:hypothetical protein
MHPIEETIQKMNRRLERLDPASVEAVTLSTDRDLLLLQAEEAGCFNGPTGHGDICWSDADPGL